MKSLYRHKLLAVLLVLITPLGALLLDQLGEREAYPIFNWKLYTDSTRNLVYLVDVNVLKVDDQPTDASSIGGPVRTVAAIRLQKFGAAMHSGKKQDGKKILKTILAEMGIRPKENVTVEMQLKQVEKIAYIRSGAVVKLEKSVHEFKGF